MIKLRRPVVVEGRYDKIRLSALIDGVIIETGGFRVFKDQELLTSLRALAQSSGLIIMTDSDGAGFKIRNFLKGALGANAKLTQVYIPAVSGKESRKTASSAEGLLGVEGLTQAMLTEALQRAGVTSETVVHTSNLTTVDLLEYGLTGCPNAAERRQALAKRLGLPPRLSNRSLLAMLNLLLTREELEDILQDLQDL